MMRRCSKNQAEMRTSIACGLQVPCEDLASAGGGGHAWSTESTFACKAQEPAEDFHESMKFWKTFRSLFILKFLDCALIPVHGFRELLRLGDCAPIPRYRPLIFRKVHGSVACWSDALQPCALLPAQLSCSRSTASDSASFPDSRNQQSGSAVVLLAGPLLLKPL